MKKLLLGLALSGLAVAGTIGLTKVNAEENFSYKEDFNYTSESLTIPGDYHITNNNHNQATFTSMNDDGEYLRYTLPNDSTADAARKIEISGDNNADIVTATNGAEKTLVLKTRFKSDQGHRKSIGIYYGKTAQILNYTDTAMQYNLGDGKNVVIDASFGGVSKNVWHELVAVLADNGTAEQDKIYTYLDGKLLYESSFPADCDFGGRIKNVFYQSEKGANRPVQNWDLDYLYVGEYNGATASVSDTYTTKVGETFELVPTLTADNQDYDVTVPNYNVEVSDSSKLNYNSQTGKFEPIATGSVTITFDYIDPLISDVSTNVTIEESEGDILVSDILLNDLFVDNTIELAVGESFDLNDLLSVAPASATNKNLEYVIDDSNLYALDGSVIKGLSVGEAILTINSVDKNSTKEIKVIVNDGVYVGTPAIGSVFDVADKTFADENNPKDRYMAEDYDGKEFDPITVVDDSIFGATYSYAGTGAANNAGASHIAHWIYASDLKANENYILTAYAKLEGEIPSGCVPRVDLKIWGIYEETENADGTYDYKYEVSNGPLYAQYQAQAAEIKNGWTKIETPVVNFDTERLIGLKIELIAYNNMNGITTYVTHPALKAVGGNAALKGVEVNCGELVLANTEATAPVLNLSELGATAQINALPIPSAAALTATYESSNEEVVIVDENGLITAVANGEAIITVTTSNNQKYYLEVNVLITKDIESIEVEDENVTLTIDDKTFNIPLIINPSDYTSNLIISAADPTIVSVDNDSVVNGKLYIVPLKAGSTTITITVEGNDSISLTLNVTVTAGTEEPEEPTDKPCTGITLDKVSVTLNVGDTHSIKVTLNPTDTTDEVTYTSSNTSIVTVDKNGKVTAVAEGTATVTVKCGDITATLNVTVNVVETPSEEPENGSNAGLIWGIVGGVIGVAVVAGVVTFIVLKKKKQQ